MKALILALAINASTILWEIECRLTVFPIVWLMTFIPALLS